MRGKDHYGNDQISGQQVIHIHTYLSLYLYIKGIIVQNVVCRFSELYVVFFNVYVVFGGHAWKFTMARSTLINAATTTAVTSTANAIAVHSGGNR